MYFDKAKIKLNYSLLFTNNDKENSKNNNENNIITII